MHIAFGILVAKPSSIVVRAEYQPMAPDLSPKCFNFHGGVSSSPSSSCRRDLVFIVNPQGANGRTGEEWKILIPFLRSRLGTDCNICESLTTGPYHAMDITRKVDNRASITLVFIIASQITSIFQSFDHFQLFAFASDYKYLRDPSDEKMVEQFLEDEGAEENKKTKILMIIERMGFKDEISGLANDEFTAEFGVVQDADRLDAIGAIGNLRNYY